MDREIVRRRHLPHWDVPDAAYFVTTCLRGSIPAKGMLDIAQHRRELQKQTKPPNKTPEEWRLHCWKLNFVCVEHWLDRSPANRVLERPELADIVVNSIRHFAGERYDLFAFVIMPSHYHWLFQPRKDWVKTLPNDDRTPRERIMYSLNRFTSNQCNKALNSSGTFWQNEPYDHWVRDVEELERIMRYIEENPVKAGLVKTPEDWPYSSAALRKALGLEWGSLLPQGRTGLESTKAPGRVVG
jgi:putative transposase